MLFSMFGGESSKIMAKTKYSFVNDKSKTMTKLDHLLTYGDENNAQQMNRRFLAWEFQAGNTGIVHTNTHVPR